MVRLVMCSSHAAIEYDFLHFHFLSLPPLPHHPLPHHPHNVTSTSTTSTAASTTNTRVVIYTVIATVIDPPLVLQYPTSLTATGGNRCGVALGVPDSATNYNRIVCVDSQLVRAATRSSNQNTSIPTHTHTHSLSLLLTTIVWYCFG
jgi:hypothetical protein